MISTCIVWKRLQMFSSAYSNLKKAFISSNSVKWVIFYKLQFSFAWRSNGFDVAEIHYCIHSSFSTERNIIPALFQSMNQIYNELVGCKREHWLNFRMVIVIPGKRKKYKISISFCSSKIEKVTEKCTTPSFHRKVGPWGENLNFLSSVLREIDTRTIILNLDNLYNPERYYS